MTASRFQRVMALHLVYRGNAYSQIVRDPGTRQIIGLWPMHPDRVTPWQDEAGDIWYRVIDMKGRKFELRRDQVFHLRGISQDGLVGMNPIQNLMREAVGTAIAQNVYNAKLFANGVNPSILIKPPAGKKLDQQAAYVLKEFLKKQWTGSDNMRGIAIAFEDLGIERLSFNPEESQFLELCKFSKEEIACIFRVPLHLLNSLDRATFNNIEELGLGYLIYTLQPYFEDWAQEINFSLLTEKEQDLYFAEFLTDAFAQGSIINRYNAYHIAVGGPWLTQNEVRKADNRPPIEGGDKLLVPQGAAAPKQEDSAGEDNGKIVPISKAK